VLPKFVDRVDFETTSQRYYKNKYGTLLP